MANGRMKISLGAVASVAVVVLIAILSVMWARVASNAEDIGSVKVETKGNTTAVEFLGDSVKRIEAGVIRLETRFNTLPAKKE